MTVSINYHTPVCNNWDHAPAVMSMKASRCGAAGETVYLTFAFGGGKETNEIAVFGTPSDMDRFTRAAAAFNAAMNEESPAEKTAAGDLVETVVKPWYVGRAERASQ